MMVQAILIPLFVQVALVFALAFGMAVLRTRDVRSGAVDRRNIALREAGWPARTTQVAYAFSNQFEVPVLFYVLTILSIMTRHADIIFLVLAWIFVLSRLGHAYVHATSNRVMVRGQIYGVGVLVLMIAWAIFMVRILLGLP